MSEIDDLYVILRAQTAPILEGFKAAGRSGEEFAAQVTGASDEVAASVERMSQRARLSLMSVDESTLAARIEFDKLAATMAADSAKMEAATLKAAESNKKLGESLAATPAKAGPSAGALGLVALAAAGAGYELIKTAGNFQASTQKIVSSAGEIQANIGNVRTGLLGMAGDVGYSAEELSKGFYTASSAGYNFANGGLTVVRAAAEGAKTEQADLAIVTDAVTTTLVDYHLKASDAAMVTTKLVAATSAGKTTFEALAASLHSVMPAASAAHISLNDILGDIAAMTVHGMSADQVTQNLSDVIQHMQGPTAVQAKELALLGMTTNQLADDLKTKGLSGTLQEISDHIRKFSPPGTDKVILDLRTALNGLSPSVRELGLKLFDGSMSLKEYTKAAQGLDPISAKQATSFATLAGSMHRIGDQQMSGFQAMQNYSAAMIKATGDSTGLRTALMLSGDNAATANAAIKTVTDATVEAGNHVKGWGEIQHTFNQKMSEAKDGLGSLAIQVGTKLLPAISAVVGWLATGAQWMAKHQTLATILAAALGILTIGFTIATIAVWAMNAAFLANPITWIIIGIVALAAIMAYVIYETIKNWSAIWNQIWGLMKTIGHWFANDFSDFFVMLWGKIWGFLKGVGDWFVSVWNGIWNFLKGVGHWFANDFANFFVDAWNRIAFFFKANIDAIVAGFNNVVGFVWSIPGKLASAGRGMWNWLKDEFRGAINWIIEGWNRLHFKMPSFDTGIPGIGRIGGFDIGLPSIPYLAQGGIVPATPHGRLLVAGEGGEDEVVAPLSKLPGLLGGGQPVVVHNYLEVSIDGDKVRATVLRESQRYGLRNGRTGMALPAR